MDGKIILTGAPADATVIARLNEELAKDGLPPWAPKVDYTVVPCDQCGAGLWVGPRQMAVRKEEGAETAMFLCINHAHDYAAKNGLDAFGHLGGGDGPSRT